MTPDALCEALGQEGADSPQETLWPVPFVEFVAKSLLRLEVSSPRLRERMWDAFTDALATARHTTVTRMPWEKAEQVTTVSPAAGLAALQAMLNVIDDIDEGERLCIATREIGSQAEREWLAGRLKFKGDLAVTDNARRCERCGVSIEDRHPTARYCQKHRNARQAGWKAAKKAAARQETSQELYPITAPMAECIGRDCQRQAYTGLTCGTASCIARLWHVVSRHPLNSDCQHDCSTPEEANGEHHAARQRPAPSPARRPL